MLDKNLPAFMEGSRISSRILVISYSADMHCVEFCLEMFPRRLQIKVRVFFIRKSISLERSGCLSAFSCGRAGSFFGSNVQPRIFRIPGPVFVAVKHFMMDLC